MLKHQNVLGIVAALSFALMPLSACTQKQTVGKEPEDRLKGYISATFNVKSLSDRDSVMQFLSTRARTRLAAWTDEQFSQAFIDEHRQFVKLVFRENKPASPTETTVTYELTYMDQNKSGEAKVTNLKAANLVQEQGKWAVNEVRNIKELIEYKNEMSFP